MNYNSPTIGLVGGAILIFLGVLFLIGFGLDPQDLLTDAIFIGFGALLVRNARKSKSLDVARVEGKEKRNANGAKKRKNST